MINLTKIFIENGNALFTVEGINEYRRGGEDNEYGDYPKIFRVSEKGDAIYEDSRLFGRGMNISKVGDTCVTLYTYNMLGKKSVGKIRYKDITIIKETKETKDIPGFEGTLEALNELTIIK
tara:strand:+ start:1574 stop:1936 length:363 start_codon:yes stop_codon:yes gene_type:complete